MSKFLPNWFTNLFTSKTQENINSDKHIISLNYIEDATVPRSSMLPPKVAKLIETFKKMVQGRNYNLILPDITFEIISNAKKVESYFRRAVDRYIEMIWKGGYDFVSPNEVAAQYIKKRFKEIAYVTEKPTDTLFEEITDQLVTYYNCVIIRQRNPKASSGKPREYFGKIVQPIAGYFVLDFPAIKLRIDKRIGTRNVLGYEYIDNRGDETFETFFPIQDVIHITMNKNSKDFFGTPSATTVLDDIRALRRMEENVEILVFQHTIPLFHYKVGTEKEPCEIGEVDVVTAQVEGMMTQGMMVTPERHNITAIGAEREALSVENYLIYFKNRILTGLGHSTISLGENSTSSRATGDILTQAVVDAATRFKRILCTYINEFIIGELLMEGGYDFFNDENKVEIFIPEIDTNSKIRKEYHTMQLYQGGLIDEDEARKDIGRRPFTDDQRLKTYFELIVKPKTLMISADEPWMQSQGLAPSPTAQAKAGASRTVPTNQFGTKSVGAVKRTGGDSTITTIKDDENDNPFIKTYTNHFIDQYNAALNDIIEAVKDNLFNSGKIAIGVSKEIIIEQGSTFVIDSYREGFASIIEQNSNRESVVNDLKILHKSHSFAVSKFFNDIIERIDSSDKQQQTIINIFDSQRYRINFIVDWFVKKSYNLAVCTAARLNGKTSVTIKKYNTDEKDICYKYTDKILLSDIDIFSIPPYHAGCMCKIIIE